MPTIAKQDLQCLSVMEAAQTLGLSETSVRLALKRGELPHARIGRRLVIPRAGIEKLLAATSTAANNNSLHHSVA